MSLNWLPQLSSHCNMISLCSEFISQDIPIKTFFTAKLIALNGKIFWLSLSKGLSQVLGKQFALCMEKQFLESSIGKRRDTSTCISLSFIVSSWSLTPVKFRCSGKLRHPQVMSFSMNTRLRCFEAELCFNRTQLLLIKVSEF